MYVRGLLVVNIFLFVGGERVCEKKIDSWIIRMCASTYLIEIAWP